MSSNKRAEIKPNSKLGRIIFNDQPWGEHSRDRPSACEYIYGEPLAETVHYCGKPKEAGRSYCAEHVALCYTTVRKQRLSAC